VAELEADAQKFESEQASRIAQAQADLAVTEEETRKLSEVAAVEADAARDQRRHELQVQVEKLAAYQLIEAQRATDLTKTKVAAECLMREAQGEREANIERAEGKAQAIRLMADAEADAERQLGEAKAAVTLADLKAKADGEMHMLEARAEGAARLVEACGNDADVLSNMLAVQNKIPQAAFQGVADAMQGMNPQIFSMSGDESGTSLARVVGGFAPVLGALQKAWDTSPATVGEASPAKYVAHAPSQTSEA
jgi:hypothetical protein